MYFFRWLRIKWQQIVDLLVESDPEVVGEMLEEGIQEAQDNFNRGQEDLAVMKGELQTQKDRLEAATIKRQDFNAAAQEHVENEVAFRAEGNTSRAEQEAATSNKLGVQIQSLDIQIKSFETIIQQLEETVQLSQQVLDQNEAQITEMKAQKTITVSKSQAMRVMFNSVKQQRAMAGMLGRTQSKIKDGQRIAAKIEKGFTTSIQLKQLVDRSTKDALSTTASDTYSGRSIISEMRKRAQEKYDQKKTSVAEEGTKEKSAER